MVDREAFQEVDYRRHVRRAREVGRADRPRRARAGVPLPRLHDRHVRAARAGRARAAGGHALDGRRRGGGRAAVRAGASRTRARTTSTRLRTLLAGAKRPFAIVGGGGWTAAGRGGLPRLRRRRTSSPPEPPSVARTTSTTPRASTPVDVGIGLNPKLAARVRDADLLLVVGARLGETTTCGYTLVEPAGSARPSCTSTPPRRSSAACTSRRCAILSGSPQFAAAARGARAGRLVGLARRDRAGACRPPREPAALGPTPGNAADGRVMAWLRERLPDDAILTNGAGNFSVWAHRFYEFRRFGTQLAPTSGAMGYGVPAAVTAKLLAPGSRRGLLRRRRRLPDGRPGARDRRSVRAADRRAGRQQRHVRDDSDAPGAALPRPRLRHRPRQPGLRRATRRRSAATGRWSSATEEFAPAFERALESGRPALIELRVDPEAITPRKSLTEIRADALRGS